MKKQLLILSLAGLFSLTACGKSRELTPVDDVTGLDRATAILEKEKEIAQQITENPENFFNFFPNNFSLNVNGTKNGKARIMKFTSQGIQFVEQTLDNIPTADLRIEVDYDNLQFHIYEYDEPFYREYNSFYDEAKGLFYSLTKSYSDEKTKISTPVANREEAEICFCNVMSEILLASYSKYLLPIDYLTSITGKNEGDEYNLLNTYNKIQTEYFDRFGNDDEYLKHQFGSNDENSFSLKNDVKINSTYLPLLPNPEIARQIVTNGHMKGASSIYYNDALQAALGNYVFEYGALGVPDLIVFENNYLSYALFTSTIDAQSAAQMDMPEGALYQRTTEKTEINFTKDKVNITNPNPDDYKEAE